MWGSEPGSGIVCLQYGVSVRIGLGAQKCGTLPWRDRYCSLVLVGHLLAPARLCPLPASISPAAQYGSTTASHLPNLLSVTQRQHPWLAPSRPLASLPVARRPGSSWPPRLPASQPPPPVSGQADQEAWCYPLGFCDDGPFAHVRASVRVSDAWARACSSYESARILQQRPCK